MADNLQFTSSIQLSHLLKMNFSTAHTVAVVLLLAVVGTFLGAAVVTDCPKVTPMDGFQFNKTIGIWYVMLITKNNDDFFKSTKCVTETNSIGDNGVFRIKVEFQFIGSTDVLINNLTATPQDGNEATLFLQSPIGIKEINATVMDTDYSTYLIRLSCYDTETGYDVQVMAKKRTPITDDIRKMVQKIVTDEKITDKIVDVNQTSCN